MNQINNQNDLQIIEYYNAISNDNDEIKQVFHNL